jgi:hypothetical protein
MFQRASFAESACNPRPKSFRHVGRNPFNVGRNDLANYTSAQRRRFVARNMRGDRTHQGNSAARPSQLAQKPFAGCFCDGRGLSRPATRLNRWDEKAGLPRDAISSQCSTRSWRNEKETGDEED